MLPLCFLRIFLTPLSAGHIRLPLRSAATAIVPWIGGSRCVKGWNSRVELGLAIGNVAAPNITLDPSGISDYDEAGRCSQPQSSHAVVVFRAHDRGEPKGYLFVLAHPQAGEAPRRQYRTADLLQTLSPSPRSWRPELKSARLPIVSLIPAVERSALLNQAEIVGRP